MSDLRNIKVTIQYDGRNYHGWQVQANAVTVQQVFQNALEKATGTRSDVKGCSRTDSGVHANMYVLNFKTASKIPPEKLKLALNHYLPYDIAVTDICDIYSDFHSRYCCQGKEYVYKIWNSSTRNPFLGRLALNYGRKIDAKLLDNCAKDYIGTYDFSAFCSAGSSVLSNVRTVFSADVVQNGNLIEFYVSADGFLYNMVRIMTGTLLGINEGKIPPGGIKKIIASKDRSLAGITVKPDGLYLNRVFYDNNQYQGGLQNGSKQ